MAGRHRPLASALTRMHFTRDDDDKFWPRPDRFQVRTLEGAQARPEVPAAELAAAAAAAQIHRPVI